MNKIFLIALIFSGFFLSANAQTDSNETNNKVRHTKKYNYYLGVQGNELLKQILNFNSSNTSTNIYNPHLVVFQMNNKKSHWGLRCGANYVLKNTTTDDAANSKKTKANNINFKLGFEKYYPISKHFKFGFGVDAVLENINEYTKNILSASDTTISTTNTYNVSVGGGPGIRLTYDISKKVLLGVESSAYFMYNETKTDFGTQVLSQFGNSGIDVSSSKNNNNNFNVVLPAALYLIIRLN